ncbi:MAG: ABC transporter substrate-binding protein [Candidatus Rokubacteria bacterium]|nr:ABC transporter substrate-binding protein [Candidatus Rokubacteria bacterium]
MTIRVRRRLLVVAWLVVVVGAALAAPWPAAAQAEKLARIGFLAASTPGRDQRLLGFFKQGMRDLGYREGTTLVVEERYAEGRFEKLPELAADLLKRRVDVLLVAGAPSAQAAKRVTQTVPIVMTNAADPVGTGLVSSLARPGGNVTGLSDFNEGTVAKRLSLIKEILPSASRVAVFYNPSNPTNPRQLKLTQDAARTVGITLTPFQTPTSDDLDRAFVGIQKERPDAILAIGDPALGALRLRIIAHAVRHRVPVTFSTQEGSEEGGLMSYGARVEDLDRRAATYVDKVLKGANPGDLPIEQPSTFEFVLNLKTARALGLTIPASVAFRADRVIE